MIVHMSVHTPMPGKEQELVESMHRFGAAGRGQPGLLDVKTFRDRSSGRLIGMARWENEASWRAGAEAMRAAVVDDPFEEWEAAEVEGFLLEEV